MEGNRKPLAHQRSMEESSKTATDSDWDILMKQCREFFRELDTNGDGRLDRGEFTQMIQRIGLKLPNADVQRAFNRTDKNRDGSISFREFVDYYSKELCPGAGGGNAKNSTGGGSGGGSNNRNTTSATSRYSSSSADTEKLKRFSETDKVLTECRNYFRDMDTDGNGKLDAKEFSHMLGQIGIKMDVGYMRRAFGHVDKDADGGITFREFLQYYNIMKDGK